MTNQQIKQFNAYKQQHYIGGEEVTSEEEAIAQLKEQHERLEDLCTVGRYDLSFSEIDNLLFQKQQTEDLLKALTS